MTTKAPKTPWKPAKKPAKKAAKTRGKSPGKSGGKATGASEASGQAGAPPVLRTPRHGGGKLRVGGYNGGAGGRPPDAFKALCRELASRDETVQAVTAILADRDHPAYLGALKWASEHGYGRPTQPVEHAGDVTLRIEYAEDDD